MRYLGGKSLLTGHILGVLKEYATDVKTVADVFAGTGAVSYAFSECGYSVNANDALYFSYILNCGLLDGYGSNEKRITELINHLNALSVENSPWFELDKAFIYQNYSPHNDCERMYFQTNNAIKIDLIRQEINRLHKELTEQEYNYLLATLVSAVPFVSNITGTYGAYLKFWDRRTSIPLQLTPLQSIATKSRCKCYNMDAIEFAKNIYTDLAYLDPPYNGRQYISNYHLLETIARYDYPKIKGITGMRIDPEKSSDFCKKTLVKESFAKLFRLLNCKYIMLSYNNEGLLSSGEMTELLLSVGKKDTFRLFEYDYHRYKNKIPNCKAGLKELIYFIEKNHD